MRTSKRIYSDICNVAFLSFFFILINTVGAEDAIFVTSEPNVTSGVASFEESSNEPISIFGILSNLIDIERSISITDDDILNNVTVIEGLTNLTIDEGSNLITKIESSNDVFGVNSSTDENVPIMTVPSPIFSPDKDTPSTDSDFVVFTDSFAPSTTVVPSSQTSVHPSEIPSLSVEPSVLFLASNLSSSTDRPLSNSSVVNTLIPSFAATSAMNSSFVNLTDLLSQQPSSYNSTLTPSIATTSAMNSSFVNLTALLSQQPSVIALVSMGPSVSVGPSGTPSISFLPSTSISPSESPSISIAPSVAVSASAVPSSNNTLNETIFPSSSPVLASQIPRPFSFKPTVSRSPSEVPTTSQNPSVKRTERPSNIASDKPSKAPFPPIPPTTKPNAAPPSPTPPSPTPPSPTPPSPTPDATSPPIPAPLIGDLLGIAIVGITMLVTGCLVCCSFCIMFCSLII